MDNLEESINRGNQNLALHRPCSLKYLLQADISSGFQVPMPLDSTRLITNGVLHPCGIADQ